MEQSQQTPNVDRLSPEVKAQAVQAGSSARALMDRATVHHQTVHHQNASAGESATSHGGNREAMMHTQGAPDKTQEALIPTDSHKGQTQSQQRSQQRGRGMER
jgi:hypothetical protein